jgi:hypothetical protein
MRLSLRILILTALAVVRSVAQSDPPPDTPVAPQPAVPQEDKRIFGVIPNYRTAEESTPFQTITSRQKFAIAFKDSFDWPIIPTSAAFAGLYQIQNQKTEGLLPTLTHEDPRYFRRAEGSLGSRAWYAVTRIIVSKNDAGRNAFNASEWAGNAAAVAISNAYYPDTRTVTDNVQRLLIACGTDAFSDVLKEFWPDVKRKLFKK